MAEKTKITLIYDLDKTLCTKKQKGETYADVQPIQSMIDQLNRFYDEGFEIIISTARNMVTQGGDVGGVLANVGPDTFDWLKRYEIRYHKIYFQKPYGDLYIDDKSCLNDVNEIERRVNAIKNNSEEEYLVEHMNLRKRVEQLEQLNDMLYEQIASLQDSLQHNNFGD
jgi:capsule biosynthesis phosphatase